jgi:hypothetical protein
MPIGGYVHTSQITFLDDPSNSSGKCAVRSTPQYGCKSLCSQKFRNIYMRDTILLPVTAMYPFFLTFTNFSRS